MALNVQQRYATPIQSISVAAYVFQIIYHSFFEKGCMTSLNHVAKLYVGCGLDFKVASVVKSLLERRIFCGEKQGNVHINYFMQFFLNV